MPELSKRPFDSVHEELSHGPKRIKKNWDTTSSSNSWSPLYGGGTSLDQEAIQYIHKFYCKDCRMEAEKAEKEKAAAAVTGGEGKGETELPTSPQSTLEEMSLQQSMDKNKESLKRKLMMRRSVTELVDQGIYPPLSTPPAFAEQRRHLERAKTGDLLKHKIQHRPDRQVLVQQHILEDTKIDPSLHERQRKLKRARIADDLNDKLSHRPGPLELLQGNILHTDDENFKTALQAGSIPFNRTFDEDSESNYGFEDESTTTSDGVPSPCDSMMSDICSPPIIPPAPEVPSSLKFHQLGSLPSTFTSGVTLTNMTGVTGANTPTSFSKLSPITTQSFSVTNTGPMNANGLTTLNGGGKLGSGSSSSVNKNRPKKPKPKAQPKTKVIKFHEYKGPPNVVKTQAVPPSSDPSLETPYHIMLQQQQLFLQWQLEFQSKNPSTGPGRTVVVSTQQTGLDPPATIQVQTSSPGVVPVLTSSAVVSSTSTVNTQTSMQGQPLLASPPIQTVVQQAVKPSQTPILHTQPQVQVHTQPQVQIHTQPQVQVHTQLQGQPMVQAQSQISLQAQPGIQAQSSGPSTVQMKSPVVAKPFPVVSQLQSSTPAQSPPTPSKPLVQTKTIIQGQPSVQLQSIIPGKQQQQKTTPQRVRPVLQNTKNSLSNITKPLMNLEDMKVADLKAELKKRNLTVSGAKPQLIERLKPYLDVSVSHASTMNNVRDMKKLPVHAVVNVHSMPTSSSSPAILSPSNEVSMSSSSPPISPTIKDKIFNPLSPEVMDIAPPTSVLTAQMKNSLHSASTGSIPMADDSSRPSSVNPDIAMDVDSSLDFSNFIKFSPASSSATSVPPTITQTTATSIHSSQPAIVTSPPVILDHTAQTSPHPSMQEEILQQQRLKIAQLQKQLEESQKILQQQMQQQHLQHHLQHNNPQQTASPPQATQQQPASPQQIHQVVQQPTSQAHSLQLIQKPTSPQIQLIKQPTSPPQLQQLSPIQHQPLSPPQLPQQVQIIHAPTGQQHTLNAIKVDADGKAAQQPNTKMVQITAPQTISLVDGSGLPLTIPVVSQGMQSILVPNLMDKTTKQNLENFVVSHGLNRSLNIATKPSTITSSPSVQQPYSGRTITLSPINGISSSKPTSLPSSPVEGKNQIMRTTSNPIFVPMRKEPPNYDDAVKNLANKGQNLSLVDNKCASKTSIKSQAMDDVLEILIRNGELPPSAAQEPPPTPKTQTSTITTVTSDSVVSSSQFQFSIFGGSTSTTTTINTTSTSGTTDVYSLLNGPITATPSVAIKKECHTPPPFVLNEPTDSKDLGLDINEMLNQDLTSMDWADDAQFSLDLTDTSTMQIDQDKMGTSNNILSVPTDENYKNNLHGSEPDLAALGINDTENVNMDVSDWLDVIMPSTGLTPLSANAPVQFPSDPILTPKTQQEVLDLFSFEDGEFGTPTDIHTGINWEKLTS
ncbi:myocardin-related transcription factor B-like isoform X3 [Ostrea edulis]|uniref:myocardin-related transcription factor B-like isoform X3 n=1 Tax=Ostrea edulis TaxID=37623 RepID=UPI0024AEB195|nr:myocardin-related transcription factor B-like isoform X3 [Ostrea edulis]